MVVGFVVFRGRWTWGDPFLYALRAYHIGEEVWGANRSRFARMAGKEWLSASAAPLICVQFSFSALSTSLVFGDKIKHPE